MTPFGRVLTSSVFILLVVQIFAQDPSANNVEKVAKGLNIKIKLDHNYYADNTKHIPGKLSIELKSTELLKANWTLLFCSDLRLSGGQSGSLRAVHVGGCLHALENNRDIQPSQTVKDSFTVSGAAVSRFDFIPGWFLLDNSSHSSLIPRTAVDDRSYIEPFTSPLQTLRVLPDADQIFFPHTLGKRYIAPENVVNNKSTVNFSVVPTPVSTRPLSTNSPVKLGSKWIIKYTDKSLAPLSEYLKSKIATPVVNSNGEVFLTINSQYDTEKYELIINKTGSNTPVINIVAHTPAGIFYGIQTLLSLRHEDGSIPYIHISDQPYFPYRGLMVDLSYNFLGVSTLTKLLDVMAMYKINKLNIGLSGDNAWRIQIPEYPNLTPLSVCHDVSGRTCAFNPFSVLSDMIGKSPRFFTKTDYTELLRKASERFIQIIPYIDMDSTVAARVSLQNVNTTLPADKYPGVHTCFKYKYAFFENVLLTLKSYHIEAGHPLKTVGVGGDSPHFFESWVNSTECVNYIYTLRSWLPSLHNVILQHLETLYNIGVKHGVLISAYDNAFFTNQTTVINFKKPGYVYAITQENVRELNTRSQILGKSGFKVILSQKDYLNLDHATEPHPDEFGDNYATRYIDDRRIYNYVPRSPCCNFMPDMYFWRYAGDSPPSRKGCFPRTHSYCKYPDDPDVRRNIVGIQAKILTRKIRTEEQFFKSLLPGLIVFADKAWHVAPWESYFTPDSANNDLGIMHRDKHWAELRNIIGNKELKRLVKMGLKFNIPLPGVSLGKRDLNRVIFPLSTSELYPGYLVPQMQLQNGSWVDVPRNTFIEVIANHSLPYAWNFDTKDGALLTQFFRTRTAEQNQQRQYSRSFKLSDYEIDIAKKGGTYDFATHAKNETDEAVKSLAPVLHMIEKQQQALQQQQQLQWQQQQHLLLLQQQQAQRTGQQRPALSPHQLLLLQQQQAQRTGQAQQQNFVQG